jgi:hypothetical protein
MAQVVGHGLASPLPRCHGPRAGALLACVRGRGPGAHKGTSVHLRPRLRGVLAYAIIDICRFLHYKK